MTQTPRVVEGPDKAVIEVEGRTFASNDDGGSMMCNLVCSSIGRHTHIDYCGAKEGEACTGDEVQHINARISPNPDKPKDRVAHSLYWRKTGRPDILPLRLLQTEISTSGFKGHRAYLPYLNAY
jgi:hypothetical protein